MLANQIQQCIREGSILSKQRSPERCKTGSPYGISERNLLYQQTEKEGNNVSHSVAVERESGKIQHLFITKTFKKTKIGRDFLNLTNKTYEKPTSNIILDGKNLNISLLHLGKGKRGFCSQHLFFSLGIVWRSYPVQ